VDLYTRRLTLRAVTREQAELLQVGQPPPGVIFGDGYPVGRTGTAAEYRLDRRWCGLALFLIIRDGLVIGDCSAQHEWAAGSTTVWLGYEVAAPSQGQGYAKEAVAQIVVWCLQQPLVTAVRAEIRWGHKESEAVAAHAALVPISRTAFARIWERATHDP
jgi:RimJ/RimL family protein N-acetyltransferase